MESWLVKIREGSKAGAAWVTTALGFTIPIWGVADSMLMGLLVLCWMAGGESRERFGRIKTNPVTMAAVLLFAWMLLGTLWGEGSLDDRIAYGKRYGALLFIPMLVATVVDQRWRERGLMAFTAAMLLTLLLSFALQHGLLQTGGLIKGNPANPYVFKAHITHNVLMAFGGLLFVRLARHSQDLRRRWGWSLLAVLAAANVLLMVQGRTGYIVLAALVILVLHTFFQWRGIAAAAVLGSVVFVGAYTQSATFHQRIDLAVSGVADWDPRLVAHDPIGERLEFYRRTVEIIRDHPLIGVGTGGFPQAYADRVAQAGFPATRHPHNQYLLVMAQVGIVGVVLLLWLFIQQWRTAARLTGEGDRLLVRGVVLTMVIGCLFNSFLIDHTEGLFFCWISGLFYSGVESPSDIKV